MTKSQKVSYKYDRLRFFNRVSERQHTMYSMNKKLKQI